MSCAAEIVRLTTDAYHMAEHAHKCCFSDNLPEKKDASLAYAAACMEKCTAAKSLYLSDPALICDVGDRLFAKFDTFTNEIRNDFREGHSLQWVDIEFNSLTDLYYDFCDTVKRC